eukprot:1161592-Pelagomonas_calceolata.AAC.3
MKAHMLAIKTLTNLARQAKEGLSLCDKGLVEVLCCPASWIDLKQFRRGPVLPPPPPRHCTTPAIATIPSPQAAAS